MSYLTAALGQYFEENAYAARSSVLWNVKNVDRTVRLQFNIDSIAQANGKFRAKTNLLNEKGETVSTILTVSDGNSVWRYRSNLNQYSVQPFKQFMQGSNYLHVGYTSARYFSQNRQSKN